MGLYSPMKAELQKASSIDGVRRNRCRFTSHVHQPPIHCESNAHGLKSITRRHLAHKCVSIAGVAIFGTQMIPSLDMNMNAHFHSMRVRARRLRGAIAHELYTLPTRFRSMRTDLYSPDLTEHFVSGSRPCSSAATRGKQ